MQEPRDVGLKQDLADYAADLDDVPAADHGWLAEGIVLLVRAVMDLTRAVDALPAAMLRAANDDTPRPFGGKH